MSAAETNFDGLVGPTHNYAGLSRGNVASMRHGGRASNPREAALQGLAKMKALADLGIPQAVLPPHHRPAIEVLRALGFTGSDAQVLRAVSRASPSLLAACTSASNMWVANAATVTPSRDTADGRVHFTPANLSSKFHRSIEPAQTARTLRAIFHDPERFTVHDPVAGGCAWGDEGAANHTRLAPAHARGGIHFFVHGHSAFGAAAAPAPRKFSSRQSREAFETIVRRHGIADRSVVHAQQNPAAIDAGVFHNDVISVGNENLFLYHDDAFVDTPGVIRDLRLAFQRRHPRAEFFPLRVPASEVSLRDAVTTYLFNSQVVTLSPGRMALIAPQDARDHRRVRRFLDHVLARADTPLREVRYFNLKESMRNGGGPACLRLRVVLTETERAALPRNLWINDTNYERLVRWVQKHYRPRLTPRDLADPLLLNESRRALDELTTLLGLGAIYPFQL